MVGAALLAGAGAASAEVRSLKLYHLHTHEKAEIVYKRNGRYVPEGLKKIDYILRDWRLNEPVRIDPRLLDLVWEAYRESGSSAYIQVICGYRAPATNSMLRSRSKGVAQKSQHMLGKAMDFFIPGVPLKKLRDIGLRMQGGGVGYYPTSGSPFVHMDVGNVRHWPGISRQELAQVFPNGKTLHVPSDGKPLPGYEQALAAYKGRKANGTPNIELASVAGPSKRKSGGLLAAFFGGGGADEADDVADVASAAPAPQKPARPAAQANDTLPGIAIVAPEKAQRAEIEIASEEPSPPATQDKTPETIIAALPARSVPVPAFAPRPKVDVGAAGPESVPFGMADASPAADRPVTVASAAPAPASVPFGMADAAADTAAQIAAVSIPLPTWRPEHSTPPDLAPKGQAEAKSQEHLLLALADAAVDRPSDGHALAMLPSPRPDAAPERAMVVAAVARADEVKAMLDKVSQEERQLAKLSSEPMVTASKPAAPSAAPRSQVPRSAFDDPFGVDAASPRLALAGRPAGSDPAAVLGGVKTTRKEARASARDARPERKATVVAAEPKTARWALRAGDEVVRVADADTAPRLAYNLVRTAPSEVYTVGFQNGDETVDAHRFTGTAVKFITVARFQPK
ncbi:DUF882 domain-containing protein [Mesorhizobium sp. PUT5]|uniref:DUF882 domain-containing protein n=1 Tax=Mesorhizobium sp. PUT5 TaxID=3454629 RepID=UPI003FA49865